MNPVPVASLLPAPIDGLLSGITKEKVLAVRYLLNIAAICLLLLAFASGRNAGADSISPGDQAAIRAVIEDQFAAFRRDDAEAAFAYASPAIHRKFKTASQFMTMVRSGYAPVYRPRRIEFLGLEQIDGAWTQGLRLVGPEWRSYLAYYAMVQQPDGSWRISTVSLAPIPIPES